MIGKLVRTLVPLATLAAGTMLAGCSSNNRITIGDSEGVPLAEFDQSGPAPTELILAGPDRIEVTEGAALKIEVSGDAAAVAALRFTRDKGALGVLRENGSGKNLGRATIRVTMPAPESLTVAGSGTISADALSRSPALVVAGSGTLVAPAVAADKIDVTIAGSGTVEARGKAERLEMMIAGSGDAAMRELAVSEADLTVAGSGAAEFASDGKVTANIVGSGAVKVVGRATCTVSTLGSGELICEAGAKETGPRRKGRSEAAPQ